MLRDEIKQYTQQFLEESNNVLYFLFSIREGIPQNIKLSEEVLFQLMKDKIVSKDYIKNALQLLIPFYEADEGTMSIPASSRVGEIINEVKHRILEYRSLFHPIRSGNMGREKYCINMLTDFIIEHDSSFDEVLAATLHYFNTTEPQYIMNAENFIFKIDKEGKESSKLAACLDDIRMDVGSKNLLN